MIARVRKSGLLWSTTTTVVVFCVLIALGNWQWQRMQWKNKLIRSLEQTALAKPIEMRVVPGDNSGAAPHDVNALRFRRVTVVGSFLHGLEMHVWAPAPGGPAWSVVTPMKLRPAGDGDSTPATHLFVVRGTVPAAQKSSNSRRAAQVPGEQTVTGRIRLDQPNAWANAANLKKNEWFTRDLTAMTAFLQASTRGATTVAPFFLEAEQAAAPPPAPQPDLKGLKLSNRHLEYAMTWWALAATLLGVFFFYAGGRLIQAKN